MKVTQSSRQNNGRLCVEVSLRTERKQLDTP